MNPAAIIVLAVVASASAGVVGPVHGGLRVGLPVAIGGPWHNGPLVNTVAAINSGALSAINNQQLRGAVAYANAASGSWNDRNALARQISQASQNNRDGALQAARDQANAINQLAAIAQAQRVNQGSNTAQSSANQAALRQAQANQAIAAQLNAINALAARNAAINQANAINQVSAVHGNAALANSLRGGWGAPATAVIGVAPAAIVASNVVAHVG